MTGMTLDVLRFGKLAKGTSLFSACMFTFVFYLSPVGSAIAEQGNKDRQRDEKIERILESTPEKKLSHRLEKLQKMLTRELPDSVSNYRQNQSWLSRMLEKLGLGDGPLSEEDLEEVETLAAQVRQAYEEAIQRFENEGQNLEARAKGQVKKLIRERHAKAIAEVKAKYGELDRSLQDFTASSDADAQLESLKALGEILANEKFKRTHTAVEPNNLPWRAPPDEVRVPKMSKQGLQAALGIDPLLGRTQLASTSTQHEFWLTSEDNKPSDADLAPTIDIVITDEIKALAESLNNNPVEIYSWVHNNIRYIPSHGSIQGAQYTLENRRGNAVDTASLLIALLRAAGVPARYAYGTVEIPVEKVMNWVGGVNVPEAAQSLLGQGGVPNTALISGGQVGAIRMEHTWVEAYVDFEPSRGVKNIQGDRWIPMDASFKQYEFSEGMALEQNVPFDPQALASDIEQSAVINEEEGWVQNIPQQAIEQHLQSFQSELEAYINNQNPDATVGEVLGLQEIKILPPLPLAAGLPYEHIITQQVFSEVPDSLRHRFKYELATQNSGYPNTPFIVLNEPTVKLAGKKLALSFRPATEDDQEVIESYLPEPDPETGEIDPNNLPDTLPGYLINLVAELTANGEVIQSGPAQTMGTELYETMGLYSPAHKWFTSVNHPIAGEYRAIGLDLQGISADQAESLRANLESTKAKLDSGDDNQLVTLTKHDVMGDLIYGTIMSYFALNDVQDEIQAQSADMVTYRLPSYGIFSTTLQPQYWFGVPRNTSFSGLTMDVDAVTFHGAAKSGDRSEKINFTRASGARLSAMEHLVPEQMFSTEENPAHGISAVKALAIASAEGQKIWTITQSNLNEALAAINLGVEVENEIKNSVLSGNVVTAHENQLSYQGWVGSGYLLIDPKNGAGAYKIAGGYSGGFLSIVAGTVDLLLKVISAFYDGAASILDHIGNQELLKLRNFFAKVGKLLGVVGIGAGGLTLLAQGCHVGAVVAFVIFTMTVVLLAQAVGAALAGPIGAFVLGRFFDLLASRFVSTLSKNC